MRISIYKVWTGQEAPTQCPIHILPLEPFDLDFSDDDYQGLWKCPKCGAYIAWKPDPSCSESPTGLELENQGTFGPSKVCNHLEPSSRKPDRGSNHTTPQEKKP